ncbi:MAG TPA: xanthine dehydrogenase family protein subunit M [Patescibacteria group bacterium]|nr:xanthine dehydrogenase family protein subunit M [Patescibacteria group bacterium]
MLSTFSYVRPQSLETALEYLDKHPGTKILAGGTDLLVQLRRNLLNPDHVLDIKAIPEIRGHSYEAGRGLWIGAAMTVNEIVDNPLIREKFPALFQAAGALASYQIRNRATLVGNICNASPGADLPGPLLVYEAVVRIAGTHGRREVPLSEFFTGVKTTVLLPHELVTGIWLPEPVAGFSIFYKQTRLKGHDLGIVAVTARATESGRVFVALSAVAPTPIRLPVLEEKLSSRPLTPEIAVWASCEAGKMIQPISDVRSSARYRRHAAGVLLKRALLQLLAWGENNHV